jgi:GxxExxY protein
MNRDTSGFLRYEEKTKELIGLIYQVHNSIKVGWPEEAYHCSLEDLAIQRGIPILSKPRKAIIHRGVEVHLFECDLIAYNQIILELKALPYSTFAPAHYAQLIQYLKCWGMSLGLLVNFGPMRVETKRIVWDTPAFDYIEDLKLIANPDNASYIDPIRNIIHSIGQQYGIGYPATLYSNVLAVEFRHLGMESQAGVEIPLQLGQGLLKHHETGYLMLSQKCLIRACAMLDYPPKYEFARMKTFLNHTGLKFGCIANFGKKQIQLFGVSP